MFLAPFDAEFHELQAYVDQTSQGLQKSMKNYQKLEKMAQKKNLDFPKFSKSFGVRWKMTARWGLLGLPPVPGAEKIQRYEFLNKDQKLPPNGILQGPPFA